MSPGPSTEPAQRASAWTRRQDERLLTGAARFAGDVRRPGQLWLGVVRSPVASGRLAAVETGPAARLPGVHAVLTARDCLPVPAIPIRVHGRPGLERFLQPVLAEDEVRYVGEPVAVVVADDPYVAEDAVELVDVEVEHAEPFLGGRSAPPELVMYEAHGEQGPLEAAFERAAVVVEADLSVGRQTGLPIETRGLVAEWRGPELHLWGPTKFLYFTRTTLSAMLEVDLAAVHCHPVDVGGMFGVRGEFYPEDFLVPWAARLVGRPVKWIEDRREHLMATNHSREQTHRCAVAVARDGTLLALRDDAVVDMGAYVRPIGARMVDLAAHTMPGPYRWEAYSVRAAGVATNKTPVGTMRGPGTFETTFVRERLLDMAAARLGLDPLELRRRNLLRADELPRELPMGPHAEVYDAGDYHATLDALLERARYGGLRAEVERRRGSGEAVGLGLACFVEHSGLGGEESVELSLSEDGRLELRTAATDVGQGLADTVAAVAAETLGVPARQVDVVTADERLEGRSRGTFSSRSTIFVGSAARDACLRLLHEARARAAATLGCRADDVAVGEHGLAGGGGTVGWSDVAPLEVVGRHVMEHPTYGFGVHVAIASVDRDTAEVRTERLVVGYDAGRAIDPPAATAQLAGGALMGIGGALHEQLVYAPNGEPLSTNFMNYVAPTSAERPAVEAHVLETCPSPGNPLGARGVGEAGIVGVGAAVANATADALGRAADPVLVELPLTPDRVGALVEPAWTAAAGPTRPRPASAGAIALAGLCGAVAGLAVWAVRRRHTDR